MKLVYIHGFNSAVNKENPKTIALSVVCGPVNHLAYNTFGHFEDVFKFLADQVEDTSSTVFVGTSLGGFYAAHLAAEFGRPSVLINPVIDPATVMQLCVGKQMTNYVTGRENTLSAPAMNSYKGRELTTLLADDTFEYMPLVLLDLDDELLDAEKSRKIFKRGRGPLHAFEGGDHEFQHIYDSLPIIQSYVNHCEYVGNLDE